MLGTYRIRSDQLVRNIAFGEELLVHYGSKYK